MKIREIAPLVGCSEGTVKSRLHHGLRYLGQKLRTRGLCEEDIE
jgi:DNA-directed RNA polymerase specialized sigma24 family protein